MSAEKTKIMCECGSEVLARNMTNHCKTVKHQQFLSSKQGDVPVKVKEPKEKSDSDRKKVEFEEEEEYEEVPQPVPTGDEVKDSLALLHWKVDRLFELIDELLPEEGPEDA